MVVIHNTVSFRKAMCYVGLSASLVLVVSHMLICPVLFIMYPDLVLDTSLSCMAGIFSLESSVPSL